MMRNDPSRRFAFGITIENTEMRVWFCCRSVVLVSKDFDVLKVRPCLSFVNIAPYSSQNHDMVIRLFVSLAFGTTSQLGYDPTVMRVKEDGKIQFQFLVGDKTYQTLSVLSDFGADPLLGRGTRVFEVYDIKDESATPRTLKDVWVDADRQREGDILADLLEKIRSEGHCQDFGDAQRHFLTVECHDNVMIQGKKDETKYFWGGEEFPSDYEAMLLSATLFYQVRASEGSHINSTGAVWINPFSRLPARTKPPVHNRVHYRIVFQEVGKASHFLKSLPDAFTALRDAVEGSALTLLHCLLLKFSRGKVSDSCMYMVTSTGTSAQAILYFIMAVAR